MKKEDVKVERAAEGKHLFTDPDTGKEIAIRIIPTAEVKAEMSLRMLKAHRANIWSEMEKARVWLEVEKLLPNTFHYGWSFRRNERDFVATAPVSPLVRLISQGPDDVRSELAKGEKLMRDLDRQIAEVEAELAKETSDA